MDHALVGMRDSCYPHSTPHAFRLADSAFSTWGGALAPCRGFMFVGRGSGLRNHTPEPCAALAPAEHDKKGWACRWGDDSLFVAVDDETPAEFADLQPDGYIDQLFVRASHTTRHG